MCPYDIYTLNIDYSITLYYTCYHVIQYQSFYGFPGLSKEDHMRGKKKHIQEGLYVPMWMVSLKQDRIRAVWHTLLFALYKNG